MKPATARWLVDDYRAQSGPAVARLFHRLLALLFLIAFLSLAAQVRPLIGARGLLPLADFLLVARANDVPFWQFPTLFWLGAGDGLLTAGTWLGALLALAALAGFRPRACLAAATAIYLSYAVACRTFTSFQWDNLLVECGVLAVLLPRHRRARWVHVLFRLVLFKLYWESGVAKWQSDLGDWHDGSAMTFYYETAPLPTWGGWWAHQLPAAWHHFESRATLAFELALPFGIFALRRVRLATAALLTVFQVVNAATANYGFFCWLAAALHVFLLDERDAERLAALARARLARLGRVGRALAAPPSPREERPRPPWRHAVRVALATQVATLFVLISAVDGVLAFTRWEGFADAAAPVARLWAPLRLVNTYHLFGHITRERVEPVLETFDGAAWRERDLRHKAGDPRRAPGFVAPHQPRLDFQLWFYGLSFQRGAPEYVRNLAQRACHDPGAVDALFAAPLPRDARAVRFSYWRYHFTTRAERRATGAWWTRELVGTSGALACN